MGEYPSVTEAPRRTCVGCRTRRAKPDLVRIAATPDGVRLDPHHDLPGRGAYVCPAPGCVENAAARDGKSLRRALRGAPQHEVTKTLDTLRSLLDGDGGAAGAAPPTPRHGRQARPPTARSSNA